MANTNDSSILSDFNNDIKLIGILYVFDTLTDKVTKESFIKAFKDSERKQHKELGFFLEDRYMEPPERLPDNTVLLADIFTMDNAQLQQWANDVRLLIAIKYNTYL